MLNRSERRLDGLNLSPVALIEIDLWPKEKLALQKSGQVLRETIGKVL